MTTFSLDEVEDIFREDMSSAIEKLRTASSKLASDQEFFTAGKLLPKQEALQALANSLHAISGSSKLLDVKGLADTAEALEELAARGRDAMRTMRVFAERVRALTSLFESVPETMSAILELELKRDKDGSKALAEQLLQRARIDRARDEETEQRLIRTHTVFPTDKRSVAAPVPPAAPGQATASTSSDDLSEVDRAFGEMVASKPPPKVEAAALAEAEESSMADRLQLALREEAAAVALSLPDYLGRILTGQVPEEAVVVVQRLIHSLCASAVACDPAIWEAVVMDVLEKCEAVRPDSVRSELERLVDVVNLVLQSADVSPMRLLSEKEISQRISVYATGNDLTGDAVRRSVDDVLAAVDARTSLNEALSAGTHSDTGSLDLQALFADDLREQQASLGSFLADLAQATGVSREQVCERGRRIFHSLKGAAATVGHEAALTITTELERDSRVFGRGVLEITQTQFDATLKRVRELYRLLGVDAEFAEQRVAHGAASRDPIASLLESTQFSQSELFDAKLLEVFSGEVTEAYGRIERAVYTLSQDAAAASAWETLERIFHQLKGAASTVGLQTVAEVALTLQVRAEQNVTRIADGSEVTSFATEVHKFLELIPGWVKPESAVESGNLESTRDGFQTKQAGRSPGGNANERDPSIGESASRDLFAREFREAGAEFARLREMATANSLAMARAESARLFHRLAGSARAVGLFGFAELSLEFERKSEAAARGPVLLAMLESAEVELRKLLEKGATKRSSGEGSQGSQDRSKVGSGRKRRLVLDAQAEQHAVTVVDDPELWEAFSLECTELLDQMDAESLLLEKEHEPSAIRDHLATIMRLVHTLKGAVNTIGLAPTGAMLHLVEDFVEDLEGKVVDFAETANLVLEVGRVARRNVQEGSSGRIGTPVEAVRRFIEVLQNPAERLEDDSARRGSSRGSSDGAKPDSSDQSDRGGDLRDDSQSDSQNESDSLGSQGGSGQRSSRNSKDGSQKGSKDGSKDGSQKGSQDEARRGAAVIRVPARRLDNLMNFAGELVVGRSKIATRIQKLQNFASDLGRNHQTLATAVESFSEQHEFTLHKSGTHDTSWFAGNLLGRDASSTRAELEAGPANDSGFSPLELDRYEDVNVLARRVREIGSDFEILFRSFGEELRDLAEDADGLNGVISAIQTEVTETRLVPLEVVFARLQLPVRDAARRTEKDVDVRTHGGATLIDKTAADALFVPLLHLVRNAVSHGIEDPEARGRLGKRASGMIEMRARQESGEIVIEVEDDGAGLNLPLLLKKGIEAGLLPEDTAIDSPRVAELVFAPALSTRENVDEVSGRGVGGDIVRRVVERMNGIVSVSTRSGVGTLFTLRLPVSLAITRVLIVRVDQKMFALPMFFASHVYDGAELTHSVTVEGQWVRLEKQLVRYEAVSNLVKLGRPTRGVAPVVVVVKIGAQTFALGVDAIVSQEEAVIKDLGELLSGHPRFSGITVRGTGELLLVMDIPRIASSLHLRSQREERALPGPETTQEILAIEPRKSIPVEAKQRVLYVDDSLSVRKVASMIFGQLGIEIILAKDGIDALEKLRTTEVDMVFTDLEMPRMHGYELVRELRMLPAYKTLPIVVVTSRSGQKHQDEARNAGATGYLTKPFSKQSLQTFVESLLKKKNR
jgi:chemosensory pili system protein ChpA (sensor histidine kinase/response regulator)